MSRITEINDLERLAAYRRQWNELLPQTPGATFFHSYDWLEAYWTHYGENQKLRVLAVQGAAGTSGFLPLCIRTEIYRVGPLRVLTYPLHDWGSYYGPIGGDPAGTLAAGLEHVRNTRRDWDLLDLRWIDADGSDAGLTERLLRQAGFRPRQQPWAPIGAVALPATWDEYLAGRSTKWRNNYRRHERRLAELGEVTHLRYRPLSAAEGGGDPRWDLYETLEEIADHSWQAASEDGTTLTHPTVRPFLREAHARAAALGMVDINLLLVGGRPVAFAYNYHYHGSVQGLRIGYDARFAREGSGNVLYARVLRDSIENGMRRYDLGAGSIHAKRFFCTQVETSYRCTHFPSFHLRAQAVRAKHLLRNWWRSRPGNTDAMEERAGKQADVAACG